MTGKSVLKVFHSPKQKPALKTVQINPQLNAVFGFIYTLGFLEAEQAIRCEDAIFHLSLSCFQVKWWRQALEQERKNIISAQNKGKGKINRV